MLLVIMCLVVLITGYLVNKRVNDIIIPIFVPSLIAFSVMLLSLIPIHLRILSEIQEFKSIEQTVQTARVNTNISEIELAALQTEIVKANAWLAGKQYWNKSVMIGVFIPDEVDELKPIK